MATIVSIDEEKRRMSELLRAVERGDEVVIAREGKPIATLSAYVPPRRKILPPGSMAGKGWVLPDDFDEPIDDLFECLSDNPDPLDPRFGNSTVAG